MHKNEYPRPQFARDAWVNLNGEWAFELDPGDSGEERGLVEQPSLSGTIIVPFCPESPLSGVEYRDFIAACWYRRSFHVEDAWHQGRLLLHFGAVNYACTVWINARAVGTHTGGHAAFTLDVTDHVHPGENTLLVRARSDVRSPLQPTGKQSTGYKSVGCLYTRTTGIWQTVWLEPVASVYLTDLTLTPDVDNVCVRMRACVRGNARPKTLCLRASYLGEPMGETRVQVSGERVEASVSLAALHLWEVGNGRLYDLSLRLMDGDACIDTVSAYFGMRSISVHAGQVLLNGRPLYQRLVLDQGFFPQGVITAPDDQSLRDDITRAIEMGFNGARMHQKVFEPRYLYWADRMGYLLWGEYPNWGLSLEDGNGLLSFLEEWREIMLRDLSSPALIGWCPFNETGLRTSLPLLQSVYRLTKTLDPTRLAIDTSGWVHCDETDIFDYHDYEQDPAVFKAHVTVYASAQAGSPFPQVKGLFPYLSHEGRRIMSHGQPIFISEFGGIGFAPQGDAWAYGNAPKTREAFLERLDGLTDALLTTPGICGFCYTQLTDVEQEQNGLYTYEREAKFDPAQIRALLTRPAACECKEP